MKFSALETCATPVAISAVLLVLICGCEPGADTQIQSETVATPPAVVSPKTATSESATPPATPLATPAAGDSTNASTTGAFTTDTLTTGGSVTERETAVNDSVEPVTPKVNAFEAKFLCWNIESEGSDPKVIAQQLMEMGSFDVYALTEFLPTAKELFETTLGEDFELIMSRSGRNDRLAIAFDTRVYDLVKSFEVKKINFKNRYRAPLVAQLKHRTSGVEFLVMNNHLARGKEEVRLIQAKQLVAWARTQLLPIVALGDYNLDYVFATEKGNSAFLPMLHDNVWKWVKPVEMIDTNWYDNPRDPDGEDDYPGSLLDFAFVSGPAKAWQATCKVIVRPGDFPDDETTSDHRPFELLISN